MSYHVDTRLASPIRCWHSAARGFQMFSPKSKRCAKRIRGMPKAPTSG